MSTEEDRASLDIAVMTVLTNVMNFPEKVQARLLGQDMRPLGGRVIDAVLDAGFHRTPAPAPADSPNPTPSDLAPLMGGLLAAAKRADYFQTGEAPLLLKAFDTLKQMHDRQVAERAWEEGARWAAVEFGKDASLEESRVGLVPSDNPYRKEQENNNA